MKLKSVGILIVLCLFSIVNLKAQTSKYQVAYLYNFTNYIEWPDTYRTGNFVIGVLGSTDPIISELKSLAQSRKIQGQDIEIMVFNDVQSVTKSHILFVPKKYMSAINEIESKIIRNNTLVVSDLPNSISNGAAISFLLKDDKLNFQIEPKNAQKYGLKINSALVQLAAR